MSAAAHWRLGLVLLATLATFREATGLPFTIVDDPSFVVHNPFVRIRSARASWRCSARRRWATRTP